MSSVTIRCFFVVFTLITGFSFGQDPQQGFNENDEQKVERFLRDHFNQSSFGFVVGLVDEEGSQIFGAGKLDNGTGQLVDGDTIFEIGSITKTFTSLLLLEMAARGELQLEDRVAKYLPAHVSVPDFNEKTITLLNLAAQDSGLPFDGDNLSGTTWWESYNGYRSEDMYAFLAKHKLSAEPGADFRYSNIGMSLLGHILERRSGNDFETLVRERICLDLGMNDTCITLSPAQESRLARGHYNSGEQAPYYDLQVMQAAGALKSTANDMIKYLQAQLGFRNSSLYPLMKQSQKTYHQNTDNGKTALPWFDRAVYQPDGSHFLGHGGGTIGYSTFIGFDTKRRRGVVVLSNQRIVVDGERPWLPSCVGWTILQGMPLTSESARRPITEVVGIGVGLEIDEVTQSLRINQVFPRSPAGRADLKVGLLIKSINGTETQGKTLTDCLRLMRGPEEQAIQFVLYDAQSNQEQAIELIRAKFITAS